MAYDGAGDVFLTHGLGCAVRLGRQAGATYMHEWLAKNMYKKRK